MSGFSADWLALREPADLRARNGSLLGRLATVMAGRTGLSIVDLGAGTGSTARAIAARLPGPQRWRLVDHDAGLLERAVAATRVLTDIAGNAIEVDAVRGDFAEPGWVEVLDGADIIAMSALLDLAGMDFLERLADRAARQGAIVYAALTVDSRHACTPGDPLDEAVFAAFNRHMRGDKGLGPALGADASNAAGQLLAARGFRVSTARSDWLIGANEPELAGELLDGWVKAVRETEEVGEADLARWHDRRRREIEDGSLELQVGHIDLLAIPI